MTVQTLADLRALNEAAEQAEAAATAEVEADDEAEVLDGEPEEQEDVSTDPVEEGDESEGEEGTQEEAEDWAKPEGESVPVKKHIELRKKLKGQLHDADDEIARLKAENEALRSGSHAPQVQRAADAPVMPKMDDPDIAYDDEKFYQKMAEYNDKLVDYKLASRDQKQAQTSQQEQQNAIVQDGLEKHYERAEALVLAGKVTEDNYRAADHVVRKAMSEALPQLGEVVLDNLIARLGDGSEKVVYHLGVNPASLTKLKESLKNDPTGFAASIYMGELKAKFTSAVIDKSSKAPRPDKPLNGTAKVTGNSMHAAYKKSFAANDGKSLSIKRQAKAKGIDTSKW